MKKLIAVVGPTASGKSKLAVELALLLNGEVVSCDSMQIYKGMDIGTAKITPEETQGVPHWLTDCASPFSPWSAGDYAREAERIVEDIFSRGKTPIVCGGSGLYLRALTEGFSPIPQCSASEYGEDAYERLKELDPATAERLSPNDRQRIARALDVVLSTGTPLSVYHGVKPEKRYSVLPIMVNPERAELYKRIDARAELMFSGGLIEETQRLLSEGLPPDSRPMNALGYKETRMYLDGLLTKEQALDMLKQNTRRYAKRQITWFKRSV